MEEVWIVIDVQSPEIPYAEVFRGTYEECLEYQTKVSLGDWRYGLMPLSTGKIMKPEPPEPPKEKKSKDWIWEVLFNVIMWGMIVTSVIMIVKLLNLPK